MIELSVMSCAPQSPCIRNCCLGDDLTCLGCFRTLQEIKDWAGASNGQKMRILDDARLRREESAAGEVRRRRFEAVTLAQCREILRRSVFAVIEW